MHFDWTVNVSAILSTGSIVLSIMWGVVKIRDQVRTLIQTLKDFPPHRHMSHEGIVYPSGMRPESYR